MTFLSPLIMVAVFMLVAYLTQLNNDKVRVISVLDESKLFESEFKSTANTKYDVLTNISLDDAKKDSTRSRKLWLIIYTKS